jgi:fatty acid desaturase
MELCRGSLLEDRAIIGTMKTSSILSSFDRQHLSRLLLKSDAKATGVLVFNYVIVALCFAMVLAVPHALTWVLASAMLAGRQLGLAILMHDCAHGAFFKTARLNIEIGQWLCAAPVLADLHRYRTYHLEHHRHAGSPDDPDRTNYESYPVSGKSLIRKFSRDLVGITGIKILITVIKMNAGTVSYQLAYDPSKKESSLPFKTQASNLLKGLSPSLIFHGLLFSFFLNLNHPEVYFLWWTAWLTFYMAFSRLRNSSEHGAPINKDDLNPLYNTRTTLASWWERLLVAPNYVNYHLEHHLLPTLPSYHLPEFHQTLLKKGVLAGSKISSGYYQVIKELKSP